MFVCVSSTPDAVVPSSLDLLASDGGRGGGGGRLEEDGESGERNEREREGVKMEQVEVKRKEGAPCDQTEVPSSPA